MTTSGKDFNIMCNLVTFCVDEEPVADNHRKLPKKCLSVLLTKKEGKWSLLGDYVRLDNSMLDNAKSIIKDNTQDSEHRFTLQNIGAFTSNNLVSVGYVAKCSEKLATKNLESNETCWFTVNYKPNGISTFEVDEKKEVKQFIELRLVNKENNIELNVGAELIKETSLVCDNTSIRVASGVSNDLTKYECELLVKSLQTLRDETLKDVETLFNFLPKYFTLKEFQSVYELFSNREVDASAFRRKVANKIIETEQREYSGSRKAKLCSRKLN